MVERELKGEEKIASFSKLKDGWGGIGESVQSAVIYKATNLYRMCQTRGLICDSSPITNGGINLFCRISGSVNSLQVTITPEIGVNLELQKGKGQKYDILDEKENASYLDVNKYIDKLFKI